MSSGIGADKSSAELVELLRLQLAELEMLVSMYPNEAEFRVDDPNSISEIQDFVEKKSKEPETEPYLPARLDFTINLQVEKAKLELSCSLPHDYPTVDPEVYVRSSELDREQQHNLNGDMATFLSSLPEGELRVLVLIQWVADNALSYVDASRRKPEEGRGSSSGSDPDDDDTSHSRAWIYSHHIFNKGKRRAILELANELQLTGFCLPGKPGVMCAEGPIRDCEKFWQRIRHMSWKKIMLKKMESVEDNEQADQHHHHHHHHHHQHQHNDCGSSSSAQNGPAKRDPNAWRKFGPFQELSFNPRQGQGHGCKMDMSDFFRYLEQQQCGYAFKDYFGLDGKLSSANGSA